MAKCKVVDFKFLDKPRFRERTPLKGMSIKQLESIKELPFKLVRNCTFSIIVEVDKKEIEFKSTVCKGFCYNMADIPWILQPLSYDDESPFVKNASFAHDYLLSRRVELYNNWRMEELGISPRDFRKITSDVFAMILKQSAVPDWKANAMAFAVDSYQKLLWLEWEKCSRNLKQEKN